jgi:hypothetical protein
MVVGLILAAVAQFVQGVQEYVNFWYVAVIREEFTGICELLVCCCNWGGVHRNM